MTKMFSFFCLKIVYSFVDVTIANSTLSVTCLGELDGERGIFPISYVTIINDTPDMCKKTGLSSYTSDLQLLTIDSQVIIIQILGNSPFIK